MKEYRIAGKTFSCICFVLDQIRTTSTHAEKDPPEYIPEHMGLIQELVAVAKEMGIAMERGLDEKREKILDLEDEIKSLNNYLEDLDSKRESMSTQYDLMKEEIATLRGQLEAEHEDILQREREAEIMYEHRGQTPWYKEIRE